MASILRYPYEALTDQTDYLQIDIVNYTPVSQIKGNEGKLDSGGSRRGYGSKVFSSQRAVNPLKTTDLATTRLKSNEGTIFLPMPSNIQDGNSVSFAEGNLDGLTAQVYSGVKGAMGTELPSNIFEIGDFVSKVFKTGTDPFISNAEAFKKVFLAQLASAAANIPLGGSLTRDAVFARQEGQILNQNMELLFNGVNLRSFKFSFKLTPRGPKEAEQVKLIINAFKRAMAPKLGADQAFFLKTPDVFNLTYKKGKQKHPFLHTFKQCALTDMSVNYTGEGVYATYGGTTPQGGGTPVSMVLELGFKELEPIYDTDYKDSDVGVGY